MVHEAQLSTLTPKLIELGEAGVRGALVGLSPRGSCAETKLRALAVAGGRSRGRLLEARVGGFAEGSMIAVTSLVGEGEHGTDIVGLVRLIRARGELLVNYVAQRSLLLPRVGVRWAGAWHGFSESSGLPSAKVKTDSDLGPKVLLGGEISNRRAKSLTRCRPAALTRT